MGEKPAISVPSLGRSGLVNMGVMAVSAVALKAMGSTNAEIADATIPGYEAYRKKDNCGVVGEAFGLIAGIGGGILGGFTGPAAVVASPVAAIAASEAATPAATYLCRKITGSTAPS